MTLCKKENIQVIGIRYPLSAQYLHYLKNYSISEVEKEYAKYKFVKILDYTVAYADQPELFSNGSHLNLQGQIIFSTRVVNDLGLVPNPNPNPKIVQNRKWYLSQI